MKERVRFSREQRSALLLEFQQSGLGVTEFARRKGLSRVLLSAWLARYGDKVLPLTPATVAPNPNIALREIGLGQVLGQRPWAAELVLPGGITLRVDAHGLPHLFAYLHQHLGPC